MTNLDPHKPALGKVRLGILGLEIGDMETLIDLLTGKVWSEGSYGAGGGNGSGHKQDNIQGVLRATRHSVSAFLLKSFLMNRGRGYIPALGARKRVLQAMNRHHMHLHILLPLRALTTNGTAKFHGNP